MIGVQTSDLGLSIGAPGSKFCHASVLEKWEGPFWGPGRPGPAGHSKNGSTKTTFILPEASFNEFIKVRSARTCLCLSFIEYSIKRMQLNKKELNDKSHGICEKYNKMKIAYRNDAEYENIFVFFSNVRGKYKLLIKK